MPSLLIQCRFIAHSYSGVRQGSSLRDQLDWPPAPSRLHQGLMACTLTSLPESLFKDHGEPTLDALRWLENLSPPEIIASRLVDDSGYRRALMVAMPHNSPAKGDFARYHNDLAPVLRATPVGDTMLTVCYLWHEESPDFLAQAGLHLPVLQDAGARLRYLGRAEDQVECEVRWTNDSEADLELGLFDVWRPSELDSEVVLLVPRQDSTTELLDAFKDTATRQAREAKPPARFFLREQRYAKNTAEVRRPVYTAIFQVYEIETPDPLVCDPINAHKYRSGLRNLACELAADERPWMKPELARELISGHTKDCSHTLQPHLAFVPLPSISLSGKGDGRVRRFALLGYASESHLDAARSIYRTLAANLDRKFDDERKPSWELQLDDSQNRDKVWHLYNSASQNWASVTPVAISRGFTVPKFTSDGRPLSSNEKYQKKINEWKKLLRDSLRHVSLPQGLINGTEIEISMTPFLPKCERAEKFRAPGEKSVLVHVRLAFPEPVRGPFLLGDRRYFGLGLFAPVIE